MNKYIVKISTLVAVAMMPLATNAQQTLTLEQCREMAIENNKTLRQAETKIEMAGYDRKIAFANYLPNISATGAYIYNANDIALVSDATSQKLQNMGTLIHTQTQTLSQNLMAAIKSNPAAAMEYMKSPMWQTVLGALSQTDMSQTINALGKEIDDAFHPDMQNIFAGAVTVQQPVFMGGKIVASNQMAKYAEELAQSQYDAEHAQVLADIEQAYWQIVSIAAKKNLAENYADLLRQMGKDVDALVAEGFATPSDALTIKVKMNEAEMLYTKATNGLALAKMLLCKECGLPLDSEITLADETLDAIPVPQMSPVISDEEVYAARPEIRSLDLAKKIYDKKVAVVRADGLPTVAVMANYAVTNPNVFNGFQNKFGGFFSAGVLVNVPIFHGTEAIQKTRKAKAEAALTQYRLDDAKEMISLQVAQLRQQEGEALEKLTMAESNLENAEENLRVATAGWNEGMIASNVVLQAQTAWLQAHSEYIETGVELQMCSVNLAKAEGRL